MRSGEIGNSDGNIKPISPSRKGHCAKRREFFLPPKKGKYDVKQRRKYDVEEENI